MVTGRRIAALFLAGSLYGLRAFAEPGAEGIESKSGSAPLDGDAAKEARLSFEEGVKRIQQSDWSGAEPLLRRSAELLPRASSLYDLALCVFKLGRLEEAVAILDQLISTDADPSDAKYRVYAETLRRRAMERLGAAVFTIEPDGTELRIDGALHPGAGPRRRVLLLPGRHQLTFAAPGRRSTAFALDISAGEQIARTVSLPRDAGAPAARPAPQSVARPARALDPQTSRSSHGVDSTAASAVQHGSALPWILISVGAASLIGAAVTGGLAWSADSDFVSKCGTLENCSPTDASIRDRAQHLALASDILLGVGLAAGAAGVTVWWVSLPSEPTKKQSGVTGITVGLRASF